MINIGLIDSGLGSFVFSSSLWRQMGSKENLAFHHITNTINSPYGSKSISFIDQEFSFLKQKALDLNLDCVIISCNTISSYLYDKNQHSNIGKIPTINLIETVNDINSYIEKHEHSKILLISTDNTHKNGVYARKISYSNPEAEVASMSWSPEVVAMIESGSSSEEVMYYIKKNERDMSQESFDTVILLCTHYPFVMDLMKSNEYKSVIDQSAFVANMISEKFDRDTNRALAKTQFCFYDQNLSNANIFSIAKSKKIEDSRIILS